MRIVVVAVETGRAQESRGQQLVGGGGGAACPRARGNRFSGGLAQDRLPFQAVHSRGSSQHVSTYRRIMESESYSGI